MIEILSQPWPWYISGPLIALIMFLLLWAGGKFGVSSTLKTMCTMSGAGNRIDFFKDDWKDHLWNLTFVLGAVIGGYIAVHYLSGNEVHDLNAETVKELNALGISFDQSLLPQDIFNWDFLLTPKGLLIMVGGGFLVGFGARWAGGCTSGHAISGLSNLQLASLIAVIGFFIGGLFMTHLLFPLIF